MSEEKTTRKKASANFALEVYGQKAAEGFDVWFEHKDGFVSPEAALAYAKEKKIVGTLRVVRVATPLLGGDVVTPEPVYNLKKIGEEPKRSRSRKPKSLAAPQELERITAVPENSSAPVQERVHPGEAELDVIDGLSQPEEAFGGDELDAAQQ